MFPVVSDSFLPNNSSVNDTNKYNTAQKISFVFDFSAGDFVLKDGKVEQCSGEKALRIWIEKILRTNKDGCVAYRGTDYGTDIEDLVVGQRYSPDFVESELKREIETALCLNSQIRGISTYTHGYSGGDDIRIELDIDTEYNTFSQELMI